MVTLPETKQIVYLKQPLIINGSSQLSYVLGAIDLNAPPPGGGLPPSGGNSYTFTAPGEVINGYDFYGAAWFNILPLGVPEFATLRVWATRSDGTTYEVMPQVPTEGPPSPGAPVNTGWARDYGGTNYDEMYVYYAEYETQTITQIRLDWESTPVS
jgi:hypothetical protein